MAIDDNADYTLTGAQVKDLASRIKASGAAALHVYISSAYGTGAIISYSDSGLTTPISAEDVLAAFEDGRQVILHPPSAVDPEAIVINMYSFPEISFDFVANGKKYTYAKVAANGRWRQLGEDTLVVNDATLTIQHNGTNVQTFTANQSTNATANIETIWADTIAPATAVAPITTDMIADGAVTSAKIDWTTLDFPLVSITRDTGNVSANPERVSVHKRSDGLVEFSLIFQLATAIASGQNPVMFTGFPTPRNGEPIDFIGGVPAENKIARFRLYAAGNLNLSWNTQTYSQGTTLVVTGTYIAS